MQILNVSDMPFTDGHNVPNQTGEPFEPTSLFEEQLRLFFRLQPTALAANFISALFFAAIVRGTVPLGVLALWIASFAVLLTARYMFARKSSEVNQAPSLVWKRVAQAYAGIIATGALWGLGATFMSYPLTPNQQIALPLLIFGLCAGTVATLSPVKWGSILFTLPAVTPLAFYFISQGSETGSLLAAMTVVFLVTMFYISNHSYAATQESIGIRFENSELIDRITKANEKFTKLAEASFDGIVIYRDGVVLASNDAFAKLLGYELSELPGMNALDLIAMEERPTISERLKSPHNATIETAFLGKDGKTFAVEARCRDIEYRGLPARVTSVRDMSELREAQREQRRQLDFLHALMETIPNPVFYKDRAGVYLGCNSAFEKYLNMDRDRIIGRTVFDLAPHDLAETYRKKDEELFNNPGVQVYESEVSGPNGRRSVIFYKATFNSPDGAVGGLIGTIVDITERKRAEEALRESEEKYRGVFESAADIINVMSQDGTIEAISPSVEAVLGYQPEEWIGINLAEMARQIVNPDDIPPLEESFRQALDGKLAKVEMRVKRKDGATAVTENRAWPLLKDGKVTKVIGIARDITLRRKQEADLKILSDAIRQSGEIVVITDKKGVIEYVNPAVERVTGYKPEELIGGAPNRLRSGKHPPEFYRDMWNTIKSGSVWKGMMINKKKNGELYHEEMTISPILDGTGAVIHYVAIKRDVTARIHAEEEILRAMELAHEANRLKDKFLSIAAHDLRTPFTSILGFLRILKEDHEHPLTPEQANMAGRAIRSAEGMLEMIGEILDVGMLQSGKIDTNKDIVIANDLVQAVIYDMAHVAASKNVTVENSVKSASKIFTDQRLASIVLRNLLSNAVKFTPAGGTVTFFTPDDDNNSIGLRDSGVGIEPDKLHWIFSHDMKTSTLGTSGEKGSGLGLPFCNDIVRSLGGRITVESTPGKGSVFIVSLPKGPLAK